MNDILEFKDEYRFLSNFYPALGSTVEHQYQAAKTLDKDWARRILQSRTAGEAKRAGRNAPLRPDWDEVKIPVMRELLVRKFSNPELREKLVATANFLLVEGNWWHDNFWGKCYCARCHTKVGENHLGKLLMEIRNDICADRANSI